MTRTKSILIAMAVLWSAFVIFFVVKVVSLKNAVETIPPLLFAKNVSNERLEKADEAVRKISSSASFLAQSSQRIYHVAPHENIRKLNDAAHQIDIFAKNLPTILGRTKEQHYVVFFLNNRELRPGGGFIGSLAFVTMKNYSISQLEIEDVYEIDGQIINHFPPHKAISQYLQVPHLFVRDSNFSPDFAENVNTAAKLLPDAGRKQSIDGAVGLTTSAIEQIIAVFGEVNVPDYNQTVTKDNFYIVTQSKVETNFFPGSLQKKSFLSALTKSLLVEFETVDKTKLLKVLLHNLNEKNIVMYSSVIPVEQQFRSLNWAGAIKTPVSDYLFPVEANVGANKANYFVRRDMSYKMNTELNSSLNHEFTIQWKNESPQNNFLGGTYKNYYQLFLPRTASISSVTVNNQVKEDYSIEMSSTHLIVSMYLEIEPKVTKSVKIEYASPKPKTGDAPYSLTIQKQIGSQNSDIKIALDSYETSIPLTRDVIISRPHQ